ncbi:MAG: saccharopine dehydrogenase C-terminal domain-containing protein [Clostridium sp.]
MKVFCLGGAGRIAREAVLDLVEHSSFDKITIGDIDEKVGEEIVSWLDDERVDFALVNVLDKEATINQMKGYDIVMDGTTIALNGISTECIAKAGCHCINLNGFGEENQFDEIFKDNNRTAVPGFGMTPGLTQMMAMKAANQLDTVESARVSHGSFRPIAFSKSITETTTYEYDPKLPTRTVFENGEFIQVPPFARPREVQLPEPYGLTTQYIIPHSETVTLAKALKHKGIQLIETRGTWPKQNMSLVRALFDYGILRNDKIVVNGAEVGVMDCVSEYLINSEEGSKTELYGYALHIEVIGTKEGKKYKHVLYHTHPASDGSVRDWEGLRAYTKNVGIPMAVATEMIANGACNKTGILIPEDAFEPDSIFEALRIRGIEVHHTIEEM